MTPIYEKNMFNLIKDDHIQILFYEVGTFEDTDFCIQHRCTYYTSRVFLLICFIIEAT